MRREGGRDRNPRKGKGREFFWRGEKRGKETRERGEEGGRVLLGVGGGSSSVLLRPPPLFLPSSCSAVRHAKPSSPEWEVGMKFRLSNINKAHPPPPGGEGMRLGTNTTTSPEDGDRAASEWAHAQQQ